MQHHRVAGPRMPGAHHPGGGPPRHAGRVVGPDPGVGASPHPRGLPRHEGRVRERPAARVSAGGRPGGPLSHHSGRDAPGGGGAPLRATPHQDNASARAADPGRRTPAAPAAEGARTDSHTLSGAGPTPPRARRLADAPPRAVPNGGDRAAEPLAQQGRGGAMPKATNGPRRSPGGDPRGGRAGHGPSRSPTGTSRAATPRSSARAMGSPAAIAIAGRCCWASVHRSRSHRV